MKAKYESNIPKTPQAVSSRQGARDDVQKQPFMNYVFA